MKHTRAWVGTAQYATDHPEGCRERETWCIACGCCEHCFHECRCESCSCAFFNPAAPVLYRVEDETPRCAWRDCENAADPAVEGVSGDFDKYLCAYHDEFPITERDEHVQKSNPG